MENRTFSLNDTQQKIAKVLSGIAVSVAWILASLWLHGLYASWIGPAKKPSDGVVGALYTSGFFCGYAIVYLITATVATGILSIAYATIDGLALNLSELSMTTRTLVTTCNMLLWLTISVSLVTVFMIGITT